MIIVNMEVPITKTKINLVSLRIIIIMTSRSNIIEGTEASVALAEEEVVAVIALIEVVEEEEATTITTTEATTMKKIKDMAVEEVVLLKSHIMKKKM